MAYGWMALGKASRRIAVVLPATDTAVAARVVRIADGRLALAFRQAPASLALVDRAMSRIKGAAAA